MTLECDRALLEMEQTRLEMDAVRAENEEPRARLAEYGHTTKSYDDQHISPSGKTTTQKDINAQKEWQKPTGRHGRQSAQGRVSQPKGGFYHAPHAGQVRLVQGSEPKNGQYGTHDTDRCPAAQNRYSMPHN